MNLATDYGIMKILKSLGVEMLYSMRRSCTRINCKKRSMNRLENNM
jgi:hypothetical protein